MLFCNILIPILTEKLLNKDKIIRFKVIVKFLKHFFRFFNGFTDKINKILIHFNT
jgi:hypothetical protein